MADRFPLLTDEQLEGMAKASFSDYMADKNDDHDIALSRAVEEATRAPLLAEIERLTAERDAALSDSLRWIEKLNGLHVSARAHRNRINDLTLYAAGVEAEREALRVDAWRYQALRDNDLLAQPSVDMCEAFSKPTSSSTDEAIDAALAKMGITFDNAREPAHG